MAEGLLLLKIIIINLVLSGDNAVVIAMASRRLPPDQRKLAIWWGAFGAVALRLILTVGAVILLSIPFIQAIGALLLLYISIKLLSEEENTSNINQAVTLSAAVWTIIVADFVMSLDNVLAIAAVAHGDVSIIIIGITISIPMIIWGSNIISHWLERVPILIYLGAAILGYTAGEMFIKDERINEWIPLHSTPFLNGVVPISACVIVLALGFFRKHNKIR